MSAITREEWERRYAAHLVKVSGIEAEKAHEFAVIAAVENLRNNGDEWLDPEDDADVELSYWENDGE